MKFQTTVILGGKTATGFAVPPEVVASFNRGKRVPVAVTINGYSYRSTIASMGGQFMIPLAAEHREAAGVAAGDAIDVDLQLDDAPREVVVPEDFHAAMDAAGVSERFDRLAFSHRKEHVRAIEEAKSAATRERRIAKAIEQLTAD